MHYSIIFWDDSGMSAGEVDYCGAQTRARAVASRPDFLRSLPVVVVDLVVGQLALVDLVRLGACSPWWHRSVFDKASLWTAIRFDEAGPGCAAKITDAALDCLLRRVNAGDPPPLFMLSFTWQWHPRCTMSEILWSDL